MDSEPYLILHKVRGQPAFDIAIRFCPKAPCQLDCGLFDGETCLANEESWWIIPTSGHRAYPIYHRTLEMFLFGCNENPPIDLIPDDWPDHYQYDLDRTPSSPILSGDVASALAKLIKPAAPIARRKL